MKQQGQLLRLIHDLDPAEAFEQCDHFLRLARTGSSAAASTGERAARRVLNQLRALSADWEDLDPQARNGATVVLEMLASPDLRQIIHRRLP